MVGAIPRFKLPVMGSLCASTCWQFYFNLWSIYPLHKKPTQQDHYKMRAEPNETSKANLYSTPPAAFAPQEHAIDACVTIPTFPGASHGVPAHPNGGPVARAGTDAALPVAHLLAGLRDDGRYDVIDAQHNGSLGTRRDTQLLRWVLIFDREWSCKPLAITANAAAL